MTGFYAMLSLYYFLCLLFLVIKYYYDGSRESLQAVMQQYADEYHRALFKYVRTRDFGDMDQVVHSESRYLYSRGMKEQ